MVIEKETVVFNGFKINVERYIHDTQLKSAILINGALATSSSFYNWVRHLEGRVNTILFDLPFAGKSKLMNDSLDIITKEQEVELINSLIQRYKPEIIMSASWGGLAALMAMSQNTDIIKKAVVASFSTTINKKMEYYILKARDYVYTNNFSELGILLNDEVGKYLPRALKRTNYRHVSNLDQHEYKQACFHLEQIIKLKDSDYRKLINRTSTPVIFINGELDEYTTSDEVKLLKNHLPNSEFYTIKNAGHFLDLENKKASLAMKDIFTTIIP
ncbi:alpha/beta fold hydrolase [Samsonia erythrinae]|uniref:Rhamnosyltransferase subunit A n=1 Tax=Samsonia erythrinae TaxID=160434 RepID=A0A4R3VTG7_9GAMM|nr:alpha/beta hydrolase [Samsonia erythrinae]TCV08542.1 rhamnosyltransferase subunit A [Samsonia erythrinae]